MPDDIIPFPDPDAPLDSGEAERIVAAANDPFNRLFPPITPLNEMIRDLRKARKLTQTQLAKAISTDQASISKIESGEHVPHQDTVIRIANALGVDPSVLLRAREFERAEPGSFGVDPRVLMLADRIAKLPAHVQDRVLIALDGIIRLVEETHADQNDSL